MRPAYDLPYRTKRFALDIVRLYLTLPKTTEAGILGKQLLRSGTSVGANYREAHRGRSKAEFIAKMGDCLKELDESAYWLELLEESAVASSPSLEPIAKECEELLRIFVAIIKKTRDGDSPKK